jgi:hypothetical protein
MAGTLIRFRPFSEDNRRSLGGDISYDVAAGNQLPEMLVKTLAVLIELVTGEAPAGDYQDVMRRFEKRLGERIEGGENVTDFQLSVSPYIPGRGQCPLQDREPA